MGNCLDLQKPVTWLEDEEDGYWEWESVEKQQKKAENSSTAAGSTKIKIKISKKQLEELLRQVDSERVPLCRALFDVASGGAESLWEEKQQQFHHHEHWKPELQSIPEVPECDNRNY